jgi:hypothetical protein
MAYNAEVRMQWRATSARLLELGYRTPTRILDDRQSEKLDRSTSDERPVLFPWIVPLRNTIHARVISRREVDRRLRKLART